MKGEWKGVRTSRKVRNWKRVEKTRRKTAKWREHERGKDRNVPG